MVGVYAQKEARKFDKAWGNLKLSQDKILVCSNVWLKSNFAYGLSNELRNNGVLERWDVVLLNS